MTKIAIINCIIAAVCIFQTAEAGLLDKSLIGSLVDTVQDKVSNTVENVKGLGKEGIQNGKEAINSLTDGLEIPQKGLSTSPCTNASSKIQESVNQVLKIFDTCIMQRTKSAEMEKLSNAMNNLHISLLKNIQDAFSCIQSPFLNIIPCLINVRNNVTEQIPLQDTIKAAFNAIGMIPDMRVCLQTGIEQLSNQVLSQIIKNLGQCVQSFMQPFKL